MKYQLWLSLGNQAFLNIKGEIYFFYLLFKLLLYQGLDFKEKKQKNIRKYKINNIIIIKNKVQQKNIKEVI